MSQLEAQPQEILSVKYRHFDPLDPPLDKSRRLSLALRSIKQCVQCYMYYTSISRAAICITDSMTWIITGTAHLVICTLLSGKPLKKHRSATVPIKDTYFISEARTRLVTSSPQNESRVEVELSSEMKIT